MRAWRDGCWHSFLRALFLARRGCYFSVRMNNVCVCVRVEIDGMIEQCRTRLGERTLDNVFLFYNVVRAYC